MTGIAAVPATLPALAVDPISIRACAASLLAASSQVDDLGGFVAGDAQIRDWTDSAASSAYHASITPLGREADAMSLALRHVSHRVDVHADRMEHLVAVRDDLADRRRMLEQEHGALVQAASRAATPDEAGAVRVRSEDFGAQVHAFVDDVGGWQGEVTAEEQAMCAAFNRLLSAEDVEQLYGGKTDPADAALATLPPLGSSPADVHAWWLGLTPVQRRALIAADPGIIGNLDGIPAADRDAANTVALDRDLADLRHLRDQGLLTDQERQWLANAEAADAARTRIGRTVDPVTGLPVPAQIYAYDPRAFDGDGIIAIAAGDLDTADNVSVVVPGFGTDAQSADYQAQRALSLYDASRTQDASQTNATLAWIGYDAPDNLPWNGDGFDAAGVLTEHMATEGGDRLAGTIDGLRASHDPGLAPSHLTVIGHSYGSTTVGHALHDHPSAAARVDDVVVVGSPGLGGDVHHAGDLNIDPNHVWDGSNSRDPVAALADDGWVGGHTLAGAGLGDDPAEDDFGAHRFQAESIHRGDHHSFDQHSSYFDTDSESLHNIATIVNQHPDQVTEAGHIHDPWYAGPQDPEWDRQPTAPDTDGKP